MERKEKIPAHQKLVGYVLSMSSYAENVMSDGVSLYWSEDGTCAEFSTQIPPCFLEKDGRKCGIHGSEWDKYSPLS